MDEPSVIIYNIPKSDALEIASAINQESIVYKDSDEFGIFYVNGASPDLFETHGLDFDSKDSDGVKYAEKFGSMLADKGSWNPDKPVGKKPHLVFTAYKGTPNSWKTKKIVGSESEKLSTTYTRLFTVEEFAENGASTNQECKFWAEKIIRDMSEKTSAINISCHNYNDYVDWFSGSILFSFPNIACCFRIDVPVDNLMYSVDDIVYIADFLHHNMLASGLADVVRDGEIFAIEIEADRQEVNYLEDNDDELLYFALGNWKENLPQLFDAIDNWL